MGPLTDHYAKVGTAGVARVELTVECTPMNARLTVTGCKLNQALAQTANEKLSKPWVSPKRYRRFNFDRVTNLELDRLVFCSQCDKCGVELVTVDIKQEVLNVVDAINYKATDYNEKYGVSSDYERGLKRGRMKHERRKARKLQQAANI